MLHRCKIKGSGVIAPDESQSLIGATVTPYESMIPRGLCQCGCGGKTTPSKKTYARIGLKKGDPNWFLPWHANRMPKSNTYPRTIPEKVDAAPFKIDGEYCRALPLSNGGISIVSASDYEWLMQWKWFACRDNAGLFYVSRTGLKGEGLSDKMVKLHRQILGLKHGDSRVGDHIDPWNTLDNRRGNLRIATISQNARNCRRYPANQSGFRGVYLIPRTGRYRVRICIDGRRVSFGSYSTAEEANAVYVVALASYLGPTEN